jgi:protein tyrosine phosphatase
MKDNEQKRILTWMQTISDLMDKEIAPWLSDNTNVYEDIPEVDNAKTHLHDAWRELREYVDGEYAKFTSPNTTER